MTRSCLHCKRAQILMSLQKSSIRLNGNENINERIPLEGKKYSLKEGKKGMEMTMAKQRLMCSHNEFHIHSIFGCINFEIKTANFFFPSMK